jgi:hypothetical protein
MIVKNCGMWVKIVERSLMLFPVNQYVNQITGII